MAQQTGKRDDLSSGIKQADSSLFNLSGTTAQIGREPGGISMKAEPITKHVLILDTDEAFARLLVNELAKINAYSALIALSLDEARRLLSRKYLDLAFVSANLADEDAITVLRTLQPDLRLVLTVPTSQYRIPDLVANRMQGILIKPLLQMDLRPVLQAALRQPVWVKGVASKNGLPAKPKQLDTAVILSILQRANLGQLVQGVVFSQGQKLLAHWGETAEQVAADAAALAGAGDTHQRNPVQIQFAKLPARPDDLLLYTRIVTEDYLVTLLALPETPLRELRLRAEKLAAALLEALLGRVKPGDEKMVIDTGLLGKRRSFAIVWRPVRPLPQTMIIPIRRVFERLAAANACVLAHNDVQRELVHLVVHCPPSRDSLWASYLFKNGSENIIQQEYGMHTNLWETGYYAAEAAEPLSAAELNLFLETDKSVTL